MKGVILAAGKGTRMRNVTYNGFPKELLPIDNVPAIRFPIEALKSVGINNMIIVIAPQTKHGIIDGLQSGKKFGVSISYVVQEEERNNLSGMGVAIYSTKNWIRKDEDFLVACGDTIICDFSLGNPFDCLKPLVKTHKSMHPIATILVHPRYTNPERYGVVRFNNINEFENILCGEITSLVEKPNSKISALYKSNGCYFTIAGYYVFSSKIFHYIKETEPDKNNEIQITNSMSLALKNGEKICAVVHGKKRGNNIIPYIYWDVGIPDDYKQANKHFLSNEIEYLINKK